MPGSIPARFNGLFLLMALLLLLQLLALFAVLNGDHGQPGFQLNMFPDVVPDFEFDGCECDSVDDEGGKPLARLADTTCGRKAHSRGGGQNVVSFAFYVVQLGGGLIDERYFDGIMGNLRAMPRTYPGWVMRLYVDLDEKHRLVRRLCRLSCRDPQFKRLLDVCPVRNLGFSDKLRAFNAVHVSPMMWRYFPTLDDQVDAMLSRDIDSLITDREAAAVRDWTFNSSEPLHVMRDHPNHGVPMMGGMSDANLTRNGSRRLWAESWESMVADPKLFSFRSVRGVDQELLETHVWNRWGRHKAFQHDSFYCSTYPRKSVGWPTKRNLTAPSNFVGGVLRQSIKYPCPEQCRRKEYKDWTYC